MSTQAGPELARLGSALAHPVRVACLEALLGGRWLTSGELARRAFVAPSSATEHLAHLLRAGLVRRRRSGRHRYYALAGRSAAEALESAMRASVRRTTSNGPGDPDETGLRFARTCYDHLAGTLGVGLAGALVAKDLVRADLTEVTSSGEIWLATLGIDAASLRRRRRALARPCLDWSERKDHLAGAVGAAIATSLIERRWLVRHSDSRALRVTARGADALRQSIGLEIG